MFPQMKPRTGEQTRAAARLRAPVIPTSFPATSAAASGPGTRHGAAASRPRGGAGALSYHLLAGTRQGAPACAGGGVPLITLMSWGSSWRQHPGSPPQRSGSDCCAGVASLLLNARRHPSAAQQDRNALPGGGSVVSIASVMAGPGRWCVPAMRSLPNVTHDQVTAGNVGSLPNRRTVPSCQSLP